MVGLAASIRVVSVISNCSLTGTLKSTRTNTFLPLQEISLMVFIYGKFNLVFAYLAKPRKYRFFSTNTQVNSLICQFAHKLMYTSNHSQNYLINHRQISKLFVYLQDINELP